jgi:hypothetical protein
LVAKAQFRTLYPNRTWLIAPYATQTDSGAVDAYHPSIEHSLARYANDCRMFSSMRTFDARKPHIGFTPELWCPHQCADMAEFDNNARFVTFYDVQTKHSAVFLEAVKPIAAKQEVFVSYGNEYWVCIG